jgi:hypothetical protein
VTLLVDHFAQVCAADLWHLSRLIRELEQQLNALEGSVLNTTRSKTPASQTLAARGRSTAM